MHPCLSLYFDARHTPVFTGCFEQPLNLTHTAFAVARGWWWVRAQYESLMGRGTYSPLPQFGKVGERESSF